MRSGLCVLVLVVASAAAHAGIVAEPVASGLDSPVLVVSPPADPRAFLVELPGRVWILSLGTLLPSAFLDITDRVSIEGNGGLLGLAFDPDYATNGLFYAWYASSLGQELVLSRFRVSADPNLADAGFEEVLLTQANTTSGHTG